MKYIEEDLIYQYDKNNLDELNKKLKYIDADIENKKIKINNLEEQSLTYSDNIYYSGLVLTFIYIFYNFLSSEDDYSILKTFLICILGVGLSSVVSGLIREYIDYSIKNCYNDLQQLEEQKIKFIDELKEELNNSEQGLSYLKK